MARVTPRGDASFPGCVGDTLVLRCLGCHPVAGTLRQHREETPGGAALFFFCGVGSARQPPTRLALFIVLLLLVGTLLPARFCRIDHVSSSGGVADVAHTVIQDVVRHPGAVLTTATCDRASNPILPSGRLLGQRAHLPVRHTPLVHEAGTACITDEPTRCRAFKKERQFGRVLSTDTGPHKNARSHTRQTV